MAADLEVINRPALVWGSERGVLRTYTGPASYPNTGGTVGDPITPEELGIKGIAVFPGFIAFDPVGGEYRVCVYDPVLETIRWFVSTTGVEVANGTDLSAYSAQILVLQ